VLECFTAFNVEAYPGYVRAAQHRISELSADAAKLETEISAQKDPAAVAKMRTKMETLQSRIEAVKASLAKSGEARYQQLTEPEKALHHAAFVTNSGDPDYQSLQSLPFENEGKPQNMMVPKGDVFHQFRRDVNEGNLPTISWLTAAERFSDHPSSPWFGAWYVSEVMDILTKNPEVWKKTIFILTYDENDGYFDHAPSFVAADPKRPETGGASTGIDTGIEYTYKEDELRQGVAEKDARSGPIGMGFRVPMIIASPWSRGGWVNSQLFDHTSTLMFLEGFVESKYGKIVHEDNVSAWRRTVSGDLTSVFRPYDPKEPALDSLDRDKFVVSIEKARFKEIPSNYRKLTTQQIEEINRSSLHSEFMVHQEEGIRPACALPYELYADGNLSEDGAHLELKLSAGNQIHGIRAAGAPFNIYLRKRKDPTGAIGEMAVATYVVKPGGTLTKQIPLSVFSDPGYFVEVLGPNGFYRSFKGRLAPHTLAVRASYERNGQELTGSVQVDLHNKGTAPLIVAIQDNSYRSEIITRKIEPGREVSLVVPLERSHNWYDFSVKVKGSDAEARYAGRVETGRSGFSDPLMGGVL
jgi:phospholipase C